jgi:HEAT repeat protein
VGKIRAFSDDCLLDSGRVPFVWLTGVSVSDSLDYLGRFVTAKDAESESDSSDSDEKLTGQALDAIAMHAGPEADRLLEKFVARGQPSSVREQASFWIGQSRGRPGYEILKRFVGQNGDPDDEFRKKVLFALSQNPTPEATDTMISVAHGDSEPQVRGEAIFWLAQKAGDLVSRVISQAIDEDPDTEVKKKAVFALSQLPPDEGVPLLIGLAKKHRNPVVRKEAIFWLGQSGDPRALDFIEAVLKS